MRLRLRRKEEQVLYEAVALRMNVLKRESAAHPRTGVGPDAVRQWDEKIRNRIAHKEGYTDDRIRRSRGLSTQVQTTGVRACRRVMLSRRAAVPSRSGLLYRTESIHGYLASIVPRSARPPAIPGSML